MRAVPTVRPGAARRTDPLVCELPELQTAPTHDKGQEGGERGGEGALDLCNMYASPCCHVLLSTSCPSSRLHPVSWSLSQKLVTEPLVVIVAVLLGTLSAAYLRTKDGGHLAAGGMQPVTEQDS